METIYKIRRISDGFYSAGGSTPTFTKKGKIWKTLSAVKLHIHSALGHGYDRYGTTGGIGTYHNLKQIYKDCELIKYQIIESGTFDVLNFVESIHQQLEDKNVGREKQRIVWHQKQLKKDLEYINKKLSDMEKQ